MSTKKRAAPTNPVALPSPRPRSPQKSLSPITLAPIALPPQQPPSTPDPSLDLPAINQTLRRLHSHLRAFLAALPVEAQTASGLARHLSVERTTCQRAASAVNRPFPGPSLASDLPGTEGLRLLISSAALKRAATPELDAAISALRSSIDTFDTLIRKLGPTRSRFLKKLSPPSPPQPSTSTTSPPPTLDPSSLHHRRALFQAAAALTGRHSQTWLAVHLFDPPLPDSPELITQTRAHGLLGHHARPDAVPLTFHVFTNQHPDPDSKTPNKTPGTVHYQPLETFPNVPPGILPAFTSSPIPAVRSKQPDEFILQTVETPDTHPGTPVDLLFGMTGPMHHPAHTPSKLEEVWALVNFPVVNLSLDVWLHRDLARRCIPDVDQHLWGPDFASRIGERWQTRFPENQRLQWLGSGLSNAPIDAHPRHLELLHYLFQKRNQDPSRYVGFRFEILYPIWRTGYRITLDFGE